MKELESREFILQLRQGQAASSLGAQPTLPPVPSSPTPNAERRALSGRHAPRTQLQGQGPALSRLPWGLHEVTLAY